MGLVGDAQLAAAGLSVYLDPVQGVVVPAGHAV